MRDSSLLDDAHHRRHRNLLFFFALLILLAGVGLRSAWTPDEPRFVEVAREMVDTGEWLIPRRGGEFYPDKPPLYFWSIASLYAVFGHLDVVFLIPSLLSGVLMLWLVYDLGRQLWQPSTGLKAAFLLLISPQFLMQAKSAQIDAMVSMWVTLGCYGMLRHFMLGPQWRSYFLGCAAMGCGILTKAVGFLPLLMLIPLAFYRAQLGPAVSSVWTRRVWLGPLVMLLVPGLWLAAMLLATRDATDPAVIAYRNNLLFHQTADRYARSWHHLHPWYYFLVAVIPLRWFPVSILVPSVLIQNIRQKLITPRMWVLLIWAALVIAFFSISPGKRALYILPALPMVSLALAAYWDKACLPAWTGRLLTGLHMLLVVLAGALAAAVLSHRLPIKHYEAFQTEAGIALALLAASWLAILLLMRRFDSWVRWGSLVGTALLIYSLFVYPVLERTNTPKDVLANVAEKMGPQGELGLIALKESFLLAAPMSITHFGYLEPVAAQELAAWQWQAANENRYLLVSARAHLSCFDVSQGIPVGTSLRLNWVLLPVAARHAECVKNPAIPLSSLRTYYLHR